MKLYDYSASGNCYKARLLLALLDQDYERVPVDIFGGDTLTDEFGRLNRLRETPVLVLDSGEALTQSNAILGFLGAGTPYLPADRVGQAQVQQWLYFEQEWIVRGVGGPRFRLLTGRADRAALAPQLAQGEAGLAALDAHLEDRDWAVGDRCTIADVSLYAYTHVAADAGFDLEADRPAVAAWLRRVEALPRFVNDYVRYPENARPGQGRSIYG